MTELQTQLESLLFVSSKPLKLTDLAKAVNVSEAEAAQALADLATAKSGTGVVVLAANGQYQLATNPNNVDLVQNFLSADLRQPLTESSLEVVSAVAYRGPISKAEIESLRGVNSQYALRHLLMRGLIEKVPHPADNRSVYYQVTTEFLQQMGLSSVTELPQYDEVQSKLQVKQQPLDATVDGELKTDATQSVGADTSENLDGVTSPSSNDSEFAE